MNVRSGASISEVEKEIKDLEEHIYTTKENLPKWEKKLEDLKNELEEKNWIYTEHSKEFGDLYISSNYGTWESVKEHESFRDIFYIHVPDNGGSISYAEAKELMEYLQQKFDYLFG